MGYRRAKALDALLAQINALFPGRAKASDGWVGDTSHAARKSDHNPNSAGVVCAIDVTTDPNDGADTERLAECIRLARDPRVKYVIYNGRMFSSYSTSNCAAWAWRNYTGANPHRHHFHISVQPAPERYDDSAAWDLGGVAKPAPTRPTLRKGMASEYVAQMQAALNRAGASAPLKVDGDFGPATERALKAFQQARGLVPDGVAGPRTWGALGG